MTYFCVSDIHGYYDELQQALQEAGFDRNNPNHTLISCGDHFDRGRQPGEVLEFLLNLPRKVLIWGNHDKLLLESCRRGYFYDYDASNGTMGTVQDLTDAFAHQYKEEHGDYPEVAERCKELLRIVEPFYKQHVDYYETANHIFIHGWVPVAIHDDKPVYHARGRKFSKLADWRKGSEREWNQARWMNPFTAAKLGLQAEKIIVCGHWHCSVGWASAEGRGEFGDDARFDPFPGDGFLAIDGCTAHTGKVNVVVIEDSAL